MPSRCPPDRLELATLAYLVVPWLIFLLGWLRPEWSGPAVVVLLLSAMMSVRRPTLCDTSIGPATLTTVALLSFGWVSLSGAGGVGMPSGDHLKHYAVLRELVARPWPVGLTGVRVGDEVHLEGGDKSRQRLQSAAQEPGAQCTRFHLSYCLGYYLPAGLAGKWWGSDAAYAVMFAWTWLGVALTLLWLGRLVPRAPLLSMLAFPLLSGMDMLGYQLALAWGGEPHPHREWWAGAGLWQYSSNATLLHWTPQHGLAGWLIAAVLLHRGLREESGSGSLLWLVSAALWSPFVLIGAAPFTAMVVVRERSRHVIAMSLLAALLMLGLCGVFYLGHETSSGFGWAWTSETSAGSFLGRLLLFTLLEFGLFVALALALPRDPNPAAHGFGLLAVAMLLAFPFVRLGGMNDLMMRGSIPALFVLWALLLRRLSAPTEQTCPTIARGSLAATLVVGALWPIEDLHRATRSWVYVTPPIERMAGVGEFLAYQLDTGATPGGLYRDIYAQYLVPAGPRTPFFRLCKPTRWNPIPEERPCE